LLKSISQLTKKRKTNKQTKRKKKTSLC